jgi:RNA polymerase sigma-70 factor, ECF subfamily
LVRAAQRGSVRAFELVVRHYGDLLYRFLYLRLGNEADAKDALQETLAVAWTSLKTLRDPNSVRAWLLTVAARQASALTRGARTPAPPASEPSHEDGDGFELRVALAALSAEQRDVVLLRYLVGLSELETARTLGVAVGTVKSRASRARGAIGDHLDISGEDK